MDTIKCMFDKSISIINVNIEENKNINVKEKENIKL